MKKILNTNAHSLRSILVKLLLVKKNRNPLQTSFRKVLYSMCLRIWGYLMECAANVNNRASGREEWGVGKPGVLVGPTQSLSMAPSLSLSLCSPVCASASFSSLCRPAHSTSLCMWPPELPGRPLDSCLWVHILNFQKRESEWLSLSQVSGMAQSAW